MRKWDAPINKDGDQGLYVYVDMILKMLAFRSSRSTPVKNILRQLALDFCPNVRGKQIEYDLKTGAMKEEQALLVILKEWAKKEGDGATFNKFRSLFDSKPANISESSSPVAGPSSRVENENIQKSARTRSSSKRKSEENAEENETHPKRKIQIGNSSEKMKKLSKEEIELLNHVAYLNPDNIPHDLLDHLFPVCIIRGGNSSASVLSKCSVIKKKKLKNKIVYSIASGCQEHIRSELAKEGNEEQILKVLLQRFEELSRRGDEETQENRMIYLEDNIEHSLCSWKHVLQYPGLIKSHSGQLCDILAILEVSERDLQEKGIEVGEAALAKFKTALGSMHQDCVKLEKNMAVVEYLLGREEEAAKRLQELGREYEKVVEEDDDLLLEIKAEQAEALAMLGRYSEALEIQLPVWKLRRKKNGERAYQTLVAEYRYAYSVWKTGHLTRALGMYKKLVKKEQRAKKDANHDCLLKAEMNVALIYSEMGEHLEALRVLKGTYEKIASKPEMNVELYAKISLNLGEVFLDLNNFTEAVKHLESDYEKVQANLGPNDCLTLALLKSLGAAYRGDGKDQKGLEMALDMHKKVYQGLLIEEEENEEALSAKDEVAIDLSLLGKHEEAVEMFEDILEKMKGLQGDGDLLVDFKVHYAEALRRYEEASEGSWEI